MRSKMVKFWYCRLMVLATFCLMCTQLNAQCPPSGGSQNGKQGSGGGPNAGGPNSNSPGLFINIFRVHSSDPNDIVGPVGYDTTIKWISVNDKIGYTIRFENNPTFATAPAQNVFVYLPVPSYYNINSMKLGTVGFGRYTFKVPDNTSFYSTRLDVRDSLGLFVDFTAGIDVTKNQLFWIFRSIDPATGQAPLNAQSGFLPVNDTAINRFNDTLPKAGEGYVSFLINPASSLLTKDTVSGKATIIFDTNEEIPTNNWTNTIDALPPTTAINTTVVQKDTVRIFWSGNDDPGGSGMRDYSLYVSENGGPFLLYKNHIIAQTESFVGTPGSSYCFFTLGIDNTGNVEPLKKSGFTCVSIGSNIPLPVNWVFFRGKESDNNTLLNWATGSEINTKTFEIERSLNGVVFKKIGSVAAIGNSTQTSLYSYIDSNISQHGVNLLHYRLKQLDKDGKFTLSNIVTIRLNDNTVKNSVRIYPNPFDQALTLLINSAQAPSSKDKLEVYTVDGRLIYTRSLSGRQNGVPILLSDLSLRLKPGTYFLKTQVTGSMETIKVIKQ